MMGGGNWRRVFAVVPSPHSNCLKACPANFSLRPPPLLLEHEQQINKQDINKTETNHVMNLMKVFRMTGECHECDECDGEGVVSELWAFWCHFLGRSGRSKWVNCGLVGVGFQALISHSVSRPASQTESWLDLIWIKNRTLSSAAPKGGWD